MDSMYSLAKTGQVARLKDLLFPMCVQICLHDTCNCFGTSFFFLIPFMVMQCCVCIVHFLVSFLWGKFSDVICHAALHQHIVVIVGIFYSLKFCAHSFFLFYIFFFLLASAWMGPTCSWKYTLCHAIIVISEQVLIGQNCSFFLDKRCGCYCS